MSIDASPSHPGFVCPSCANESSGTFCTSCGERKPGSEDRSLRHYLDIAINFLTHFDSKGYRSLATLVAKPGFLSEAYLRGTRVPYAKPLALFISINVVYYFSIALVGANTFTTPLSVQLHMNDYYAGFASQVVQRRLDAMQLAYAAFETRFDERAGVLSRTLIFLFIPIYAVMFRAFFFKYRRFFVDHVVVATHLWSFILLLLALLVPAIALALMAGTQAPGVAAALAANDAPVSIFLQLCIGVYLALMFRRVYAARYAYCIAVAVLIAWSFFHIVWLYRFLLFVITAYSL